MKILIIEDDPNKLKQIESAIAGDDAGHQVVSKGSYQSGLKEALRDDFDLVILDMTMPTYDISPSEPGGRIRPYAGREILSELRRRKRRAKAVVVTQFESFGDGKDALTLAELGKRLAEDYRETYLGAVFYSASESGWRKALADYVKKAG